MPSIILASSSIYRRELLARLRVPFEYQSPNIDETPATNETAEQLVKRLALKKAQAIAKHHANHIIIASDQTAELNNKLLNKPLDHQTASLQLQNCSGQKVRFFTSLQLINTASGHQQSAIDITTVYFRKLNKQQIERYLLAEQPYDCAGSFKVEGLGISLFEKISSDDPSSLMGLPLIQLISMLNIEGLELP